MQLTLALLELPAPPAMPGVRLDPEARAKAVVKATTHFNDPKAVLEASEELGEAMKGLDIRQMDEKDMLQTRGW